MTLLEYAELCNFQKYFTGGHQRLGQFLYNWTYKRFPKIASSYSGVDGIDPFHDDDNIKDFLSAILNDHVTI